MEIKQPYGGVLIKASKLLTILSDYHTDKAGLTLTEIAEKASFTPSTTLKILDTLLLIGYVHKNEELKTYTLGARLARFGNQYLHESELIRIARPYLNQLHQEVDETIHLGLLENNQIVYLDKLEPERQTIVMSSRIGNTRPLYGSAMGKAVLAVMDDKKMTKYIEQVDIKVYTPNTILDKSELLEEIEKVKETALAYDNEELEKDCFCIGMSLPMGNNEYGAFSVSLPKFRATPEEIDRISTLMKETQKNIIKLLQKEGE
ncbi:IclR family transcriptional regulator [Vagococcus humatus]|uniref:IclR family transcriptional regulator n=1 Tax=Vagococcus humatus TaxID=1889241 RepID=A0A3S0ABQ9_9ENTE|nr:IclR family transcriptional regulator [Vagococcus humatus]RST89155.1 IclR family transcriptional regulator [Vagococcus humatus]